jgi:hypothetical protein
MVYSDWGYWVFGLCPFSDNLNNTMFRKLDLFPSSGERVGENYFVGSVVKSELQSLILRRIRCVPGSNLDPYTCYLKFFFLILPPASQMPGKLVTGIRPRPLPNPYRFIIQ